MDICPLLLCRTTSGYILYLRHPTIEREHITKSRDLVIPSALTEVVEKAVAKSDLTVSYKYRNTSISPLWITTRSNITYKIPPRHRDKGEEAGLYMTIEIIGSKDVIFDVGRRLNVPASKMLEKLGTSVNETIIRRQVMEVTLFTSHETMSANNGLVYVSDADVLVATSEIFSDIPHPHSPEGKFYNDSSSMGLELMMRLIDNGGVIDIRYVNIGGKISKLLPQQDPTLDCGLYISNQDSVMGYTYIPIDQIDDSSEYENLIFKSHEEAVHYGNTATIEERNYNREILGYKHEIEQLKSRNARENEYMDRRQKEYEHELRMRELTRKDTLEQSKSVTDVIKYTPLVVGGLTAIITAIKALSK